MSESRTYLKIATRFVLILLVLSMSPGLKAQLPDIPDLIRITVDHSDDGVLIQWEPSDDTDIMNYQIWQRIPGTPPTFIHRFTLQATTFEYKILNSGLNNLAYSVIAEDSSLNRNPFEDNVHQAVKVSTEYDICTQSNFLQWTEYEGWEGQISGYNIFGAEAGAAFQNLGFVDASTTSYTHSNVLANSNYVYYVETINALRNISSLSPIDTVYTTYPEPPSYLTIDHVTVLDESSVEIQYSADIAGPVTSFILLRRSSTSTPFTEVDAKWNIMQSTQVVQDQFQTGNISYQYLVESVFQPVPCDNPIKISESNTGNSILLVNEVNDQIVMLSWTAYENYDPGLAGYLIQRNSGDGQFVDLETVGPLSTQWSDNIQSLINGNQQGEIQYRVIALSNPDGGGIEEQSLSNITSVLVETHMQVPSAFTPGSNDINGEFKPLIDFAPKDYVMIVMDRGGRKMFETTNPAEGWDGRFNGGDYVQEAVYIYYIEYTDYKGLLKTFTGNVTVLYP